LDFLNNKIRLSSIPTIRFKRESQIPTKVWSARDPKDITKRGSIRWPHIRGEKGLTLRQINFLPKNIAKILKDPRDSETTTSGGFNTKQKIISKKQMGESRASPRCSNWIPGLSIASFKNFQTQVLHTQDEDVGR
jgi:hypothetical protein